MSTIGTVELIATIDTAKYKKGANEIETANKNIESSSGSADSGLSKLAKNGLKIVAVAATAAAIALGNSAVTSAASYQDSLSKLQQASSATSGELQSMSGLARQLGRDNTLVGVTASDAALTMVELSKAGLSVNDTMAASRGVMALARAGNIDFAQAAIIAASALNAFQLKGEDATKVADALAAGANASQADLGDLAEGLQQSATVAQQFSLGLNDTVTALALFANNGIRGSDAGTSLKTMLIALAKPSNEAATAMKKIGFNAYDAKGNFVGLEEMSKRLNKGLSKLTDQQKQNTLSTIFGNDAFRAAAVLSDNAGESYTNMAKAIGVAGSATAAAKAQLGPFNSAMENLSNQVSEVMLRIGDSLMPVLTSLAKVVGDNIVPAFEYTVTTVGDLARSIGNYLGPKLSGLGDVIINKVLPALSDFWHNYLEQLVPVIGVTLVGAIGFVTDALRIVLGWFGQLVTWINNNQPLVYGLATAFGVLAANMAFTAVFNALKIGFATLQLVTIPSVMASIGAMQAMILSPIVMPAIVVAAALAAIAAVMVAYQQLQTAIQGAESAKQSLIKSNAASIQPMLQIAQNGYAMGKTDAQIRAAKSFLHNAGYPGYATGGFTGIGPSNEVAGLVHRGEFVLPKSAVDQSSGTPKAAVGDTYNIDIKGVFATSKQEQRAVAEIIVKRIQEVKASKAMTGATL